MIDIQLHGRSNEERPSQSALVAFQSPKARAMLVMAGAMSLGLWAAIWLALTSLASAWSSFRWDKILATAIIVVTTFATDSCKSEGVDAYKSSRQMLLQGAGKTGLAATVRSALDESLEPRLVTVGVGKDPIDMQLHDTRQIGLRTGARPRRDEHRTDGEEKWHAKSA